MTTYSFFWTNPTGRCWTKQYLDVDLSGEVNLQEFNQFVNPNMKRHGPAKKKDYLAATHAKLGTGPGKKKKR